MSLTTGRGPLSARPAGRFTVPMPERITYIEPYRRRVRGTRGGATVVESERVLLVHSPGQPPHYAFPKADVMMDVATTDESDAPDYVTVEWNLADAWFEEGEEVFGHPKNPYHRVDCLRAQRRLVVGAGGTTLVDTSDTLAVYETALEPRLYVAPHLVRMDLLEPSLTTTYCPYKGTASHWTLRFGDAVIEDVAWSYEEPLAESTALAHCLSFYESKIAVQHDLPNGE